VGLQNTGAPGNGGVSANTTPLLGHPSCWVAPLGAVPGQPSQDQIPRIAEAAYPSK
jgi:hypothetical protein